ncbi:MAG TPA: hypothetical protein VD997_08105 [Phycisphaerales bacterium]|nr:hypothetical protein [Phycisphaerales bacterium]
MSQIDDPSVVPASMRPRSRGNAILVWLAVIYAVALGLSILLIVQGDRQLGAAGALLVLTMGPVGFVLAMSHADRRREQVMDRLEELTRTVRALNNHASLSNDARRVLNRQAERDLLRLAIEEDVNNKNWDAAMVLVKELADNFGYRADAEEFRRKIDQARAQTVDREINEAVAYLDGLIIQRRWDEAFADAARLMRLYPELPRVESLKARVEQARDSYKKELERRFLQAANEGRPEEALSLMKELDPYLTVTEAEPLREKARNVIGMARDTLGSAFKMAVQDRQWREAARLGDRIIAEFPNSRMAAEVKDVIDGIRMRANEMQAV